MGQSLIGVKGPRQVVLQSPLLVSISFILAVISDVIFM